MKVAQNEQLTVVDQHVADRRLALQKTKKLHKQLDEMKPNAVFNSEVKRTTEQTVDPDTKKMTSTFNSTQLKTGSMVIAKSPIAHMQTTVVVDRPGQDEGFFVPKQALLTKSTMFNSTSPRFNYRKEQTIRGENPGPGSYESTQEQSFKDTMQSSTIFQ